MLANTASCLPNSGVRRPIAALRSWLLRIQVVRIQAKSDAPYYYTAAVYPHR